MNNWSESEDRFTSWDGTQLFYRSWRPATNSDKALIIIHRGHEHSGRIARQVEGLGLTDFWAFSWDNRGHGQSPGERGHADDYYHLVKDLDAFVRFISEHYGIPMENIAVVANSVGAVTAATWVHDFAPRIRALVLAAPAFRPTGVTAFKAAAQNQRQGLYQQLCQIQVADPRPGTGAQLR
jgi:alpha-beta hydrolase superfamily lysophospholipase